jgi:hypothetical protein
MDVTILPQARASISLTTGNDKTSGPAPRNGVDLGLRVNNLFWSHVTYSFDCGNGRTLSHSINGVLERGPLKNDGYYSYTAKDACSYEEPGIYTAKATANIRAVKFPGGINGIENILPFTTKERVMQTRDWQQNYIEYNEELTPIDIVVTGEGKDGVWVVTAPFKLKWSAENADTCRIEGVSDDLLSRGETKISGVSVGAVRDYKLVCQNKGGRVEKTIKVKVVKVME